MEVDCRHFVVDEPRERRTGGELLSPASLATQQPAAPSVMGNCCRPSGCPVRSPDQAGFGRQGVRQTYLLRGFASRASSGREMTRSSKKPLSQPATARWWLFRSPVVLCFARDTPSFGGLFHVIAHRPTGDTVGPPLGWEHEVARRQRCSAESAAAGSCRFSIGQPLDASAVKRSDGLLMTSARRPLSGLSRHQAVLPQRRLQSCWSSTLGQRKNAGMLGLSLASSQTSRAMLLHPRLGMTVPQTARSGSLNSPSPGPRARITRPRRSWPTPRYLDRRVSAAQPLRKQVQQSDSY